ncbi:MAG: sigma-54-dependent Fis family transcriptional regulator, partial [Deltaproteobacteria bacterium]|nr:sigma-54-dependent Fis family transcriptional regulator [Deltaproteobacteria bacterium]
MNLTDSKNLELLDDLIRLCDDLAWGRQSSEAALYRLTSRTAAPPELARLAEAFGLMLVKLETRSMERDNLVADLRSRNAELEDV